MAKPTYSADPIWKPTKKGKERVDLDRLHGVDNLVPWKPPVKSGKKEA